MVIPSIQKGLDMRLDNMRNTKISASAEASAQNLHIVDYSHIRTSVNI